MMKQMNNENGFISKIYSNKRLISRTLLIFEKLVSFLMTAFMANRLSYSDIGFWSQVLFSGSLFTAIISFNIPNGIIAIVPRINRSEEKYEFIFKSALFVITSGLIFCLFLILLKDFISNLLFNNVLNLNIYGLILIIGFAELFLEFVLYSFRSVKNFSFSNIVLLLRIFPRLLAFAGILMNNVTMILYLYAGTYFISCFSILVAVFKFNRNKILIIIKNKLNIKSLLTPKEHFRSLASLSRKSVFAIITASLFSFLIRSITLSNSGLDGVGEFSLAISAGATILSLTTFIGFTFYPYVSNLAIIEKDMAFLKSKQLSLKIIYSSILISFIIIIFKIIFNDILNFYPFTIDSIDLILGFLAYGFLGAYQITQPFAFALTDNINVIKIEILSSLIALTFISFIILSNKFSIHLAILSFCLYALCNYLQATNRNFKILKYSNF